jgi:peptide/nickel transport system permease protein
MASYALRRLLWALPTLILLSWIIFGLSQCAPGDPVRDIFGENNRPSADPEAAAADYRAKAAQLGLDKPAFYLGIGIHYLPDTLHRIFPPERRRRLRQLALQVGNWPAVQRYEQNLAQCLRQLAPLPDSLPGLQQIRLAAGNFLLIEQVPHLDTAMLALRRALARSGTAALAADSLQNAVQALHHAAAHKPLPLPTLRWHGLDNQYHHWVSGFATGQMGRSLLSKRTVWAELKPRLMPTLALNGLAILLAYLLAVPLGLRMAARAPGAFDRYGRSALLLLYAMPTFWLGSLLILFLGTPDFGLGIIRGISVSDWNPERSFWHWLLLHLPKLLLPVLTLALHVMAVLALQMRSSALEVLRQDYVRAARAKGMPERQVLRRHVLRNAAFPLIAAFGSLFPSIFAGSLVIEYLFNYPGMGTKTQAAFMDRDYPVLFAILMIAAALTILGTLLADLLYKWADPRVRIGDEN